VTIFGIAFAPVVPFSLISRQAQMDAVHDVLDTKVNEKPFEDTKKSFGGHGLTMLDPTRPDRNAMR
jgi:hypothetical protein